MDSTASVLSSVHAGDRRATHRSSMESRVWVLPTINDMITINHYCHYSIGVYVRRFVTVGLGQTR